jgi:hypothetical protein
MASVPPTRVEDLVVIHVSDFPRMCGLLLDAGSIEPAAFR